MNSFIAVGAILKGRICMVELYVLLATVSLVLQIVTLLALAFGISAKLLGKLFLHGSIMFVAVIIHAVSFLLVMGPSFFSMISENVLFSNLPTELSVAILAHASLGIIAELLGIWLVFGWRFKPAVKICFGRKPIMRLTLALWVSALLLGVWTYFSLYSGLI